MESTGSRAQGRDVGPDTRVSGGRGGLGGALLALLAACGGIAEEPAAEPAPNPLTAPAARAVNPLVSQAAPDPLVGVFSGDALTLRSARAGDGYTGELQLGDTRLSFRARADGRTLAGTFTADGTDFPFSAELLDGVLVLETEGTRYRLLPEPRTADEAARPEETPPLAAEAQREEGPPVVAAALEPGEPLPEPEAHEPSDLLPVDEAPVARQTEPRVHGEPQELAPATEDPAGEPEPPAPVLVAPPPSLAEVYSGPVEPFQHPRGWYSLQMPRGWSLADQSDEYLVINPGLREGGTLDAIVMVGHGRLEPEERSRSIEELFEDNQAQMQELFRELQLRMRQPRQKPERVLVGDVPGAQQTWTGRTTDGKAVIVWVGGLVKREYYLLVFGLALEEKRGDYLPGVKRIFGSLELTPPERNPKLEALLAGREVAHNRTDSSGSSSYIYTFRPDRSVHKLSIISFANTGGIGVPGGSSEEVGRFEVIGDELYLYFRTGQSVGTVVLEAGRLSGVQFGSAFYRAR